ncbi:ogr/Delta-like zinc finger family protein [Histophilus somni]|uniref:ogr/Delta-like zinc finger family protein n=1 Tax=Histophilus somni TaxID=731 RepID=UPI00201E791C|nr:ogr/Delta-like zinc finger family protein [Histophilus somni]
MARVLKMECRECGSDAIIQRTDRIHPDFYILYCCCKNINCGHRWKAELNYKVSLNKNPLNDEDILNLIISKTSLSDIRRIANKLNDVIKERE